jgi:hypothetical protein
VIGEQTKGEVARKAARKEGMAEIACKFLLVNNSSQYGRNIEPGTKVSDQEEVRRSTVDLRSPLQAETGVHC